MAEWYTVTLEKSFMIAHTVMGLRFSAPEFPRFKAGQHVDVRLTASDGYQAERSYSLANPPEERGVVELGVELLEDGEVSPYLFQLQVGDSIELRGPIGGHFVWDTSVRGPLFLIGGGSGMVPLMSMLRHYVAHAGEEARDVLFFISARTMAHVLYREELEGYQDIHKNISIRMTLTDDPSPDWAGYRRRVDQQMLQEVSRHLLGKKPNIFVCGPTAFVEVVAKNLLAIGFPAEAIKTERFGGA